MLQGSGKTVVQNANTSTGTVTPLKKVRKKLLMNRFVRCRHRRGNHKK